MIKGNKNSKINKIICFLCSFQNFLKSFLAFLLARKKIRMINPARNSPYSINAVSMAKIGSSSHNHFSYFSPFHHQLTQNHTDNHITIMNYSNETILANLLNNKAECPLS
jgi:hypothetical protein